LYLDGNDARPLLSHPKKSVPDELIGRWPQAGLARIPVADNAVSQDLGAADSIDQVGNRLVSSTNRIRVRPHNG
jgi:hypothetical protein